MLEDDQSSHSPKEEPSKPPVSLESLSNYLQSLNVANPGNIVPKLASQVNANPGYSTLPVSSFHKKNNDSSANSIHTSTNSTSSNFSTSQLKHQESHATVHMGSSSSLSNTNYDVYEGGHPAGPLPPRPAMDSFSSGQPPPPYIDSMGPAKKMYHKIQLQGSSSVSSVVSNTSNTFNSALSNRSNSDYSLRNYDASMLSTTSSQQELAFNTSSSQKSYSGQPQMSRTPLPSGLGQCFECSQVVTDTKDACQAMGNLYHTICFTCNICKKTLRGKAFYKCSGKIFCEEDFFYSGFQEIADKCTACKHPIIGTNLEALGSSYHPKCFKCSRCHQSLVDQPFTIDIRGDIFCLPDFHATYAPRCVVCQRPICSNSFNGESERIVYLEADYHVACFRESHPESRVPSVADLKQTHPGSPSVAVETPSSSVSSSFGNNPFLVRNSPSFFTARKK